MVDQVEVVIAQTFSPVVEAEWPEITRAVTLAGVARAAVEEERTLGEPTMEGLEVEALEVLAEQVGFLRAAMLLRQRPARW